MSRPTLSVFAGLLAGVVSAVCAQAVSAQLTIEQAATLAPSQPRLADAAVVSIAGRWTSANFESVPWALLPPDSALRLHVRARFFDAVLADIEEGALNEELAIAFIRSERARDGAASSRTAVLALESRYQVLLMQRDAVRLAQRSARSLLAIAMRDPGRLPAELIEPSVTVATVPVERWAEVQPATVGHAVEAERLHARLEMRSRAAQAAGSELTAARKRLQHAEALLDDQRAAFARPGASGLDLGEAMAGVARAQFNVRRAEYRAVLYREVAEALATIGP